MFEKYIYENLKSEILILNIIKIKLFKKNKKFSKKLLTNKKKYIMNLNYEANKIVL